MSTTKLQKSKIIWKRKKPDGEDGEDNQCPICLYDVIEKSYNMNFVKNIFK